MNIEKEKKDSILNISVSGRLDTNTAPELEEAIEKELEGIKEFNLNLSKLDYISSAGLRVVLKYHKHLKSMGGTLYIISPKDEVLEIFDMTGFSTFLKIKE